MKKLFHKNFIKLFIQGRFVFVQIIFHNTLFFIYVYIPIFQLIDIYLIPGIYWKIIQYWNIQCVGM